jgi:hypothetical protein
MDKSIFGEFMGTMLLILMGNAVTANVLLKKAKGEDSGWIVITTGWAMSVMAGVFTATACGSTDAHLNPAVTVGFAVATGDFSKLYRCGNREGLSHEIVSCRLAEGPQLPGLPFRAGTQFAGHQFHHAGRHFDSRAGISQP